MFDEAVVVVSVPALVIVKTIRIDSIVSIRMEISVLGNIERRVGKN
jgi:hypothetical protein